MKDFLQKKIANEQKIIDRLAGEVTRDWQLVEAEIRKQAFEEVLKEVERQK